jgi:hypothetical protein
MSSISLENNNIELKANENYIVIDPLYINDINDCGDKISNFEEIRKTCFPYTDTPFTSYKSNSTLFITDRIKKVKDNDLNAFSVDSGSIIFVKEDIFFDFIIYFDYNKLFDSTVELVNINYWKFISNKYDLGDVGLIVSVGINNFNEFDGSGTYKLDNSEVSGN